MRYSLKFKLDCIRKKKDGKFVATPEGVKRKSFTTKLGTWIRTYDVLGIKGLKHNKKPLTVYKKISLIKRIELGESISEVSISTGRSNSLVSKWYKIYRQKGIDGLKSLKRGRKKKMKKPSKDKNKSELKQLRKENEYYKSQKHLNACKRKETEDNKTLNRIKEIFDEHKSRYGYRRVYLELKKTIKINHKKVQRIMRENNLKGIHSKVKYHSYKGDNGLSKKNLLLYSSFDGVKQKEVFKRDFKANRPNEKWTTDVSEFHIPAGKLYLSPILDMFDSSIISYNISTSPNFNQVTDMLNTAFDKYKNLSGLIFHSDQGWQYQMKYYQQRLIDKGIKQSFSRKGNCMDNSLMENFFGIMKNEMFYGQEYKYKTLDILKESMIEYIDYYNNKRINIKRKGLTPIEFRNQSLYKYSIN